MSFIHAALKHAFLETDGAGFQEKRDTTRAAATIMIDANRKSGDAFSIRRLVITRKRRPGPFLWCVALFCVYAASVGLLLPYFTLPLMERGLSQEFGVPCSIRRLGVDPLSLNIVAQDVTIPYPEDVRAKTGERFVRLERLEMTPSLTSITEKALVLKDFRLIRPHIRLVRFKDGSLSPQLLFKGSGGDENLFPLVVRNMTVRGGVLDFVDEFHDATHAITDINLSVPFASTLYADKDVAVTPKLSAVVNGKEISVDGESRPFAETRQTVFTLRTRELDLAEFRNYIAPYTNLTLQSGALQSAVTLRFAVDPEKAFDFSLAGTVEVVDLNVTNGKTPVFKASRIGVDMENAVLGPRRVVVNSAVLENPELVVRRQKDGRIDWEDFFFLPETAYQSDVRLATGRGEELPRPPSARKEKSAAPEGIPLQLVVDDVRVVGGKVTWRDARVKKPVYYTAENITAAFTDVSTENEGRANFAVSFGAGKTSFSAKGKATATPLRIDAGLVAANVSLHPFVGYLAENTDFLFEGGTLDVKGNIVFQHAPVPVVQASDAKAALSGLKIFMEGDRTTPFLEVGAFQAERIAADMIKQTIVIDNVSGSGIALNATRGKDGTVLLPSFVAAKDVASSGARKTSSKKENAQKAPWAVSVNSVAFDKSRASFTDNALRTKAVLPLTDIAATGGGFSTEAKKQWRLSVSGKPGGRGSLSVAANGTLFPLDLRFSGKMDKADMRPLSPYLGEVSQLALTEATLGGDFSGSARLVPKSARGGEFFINGNLGLYGISLVHGRRELGGWGRLRLADVAYKAPAQGGRNLSIGSIAVNSPRLSVTIDKNGVSSLAKALRPPGDDAKNAASGEAEKRPSTPSGNETVQKPFPLTTFDIGAATLSLGQAAYTDRRVSPPYFLSVDAITASVKNITFDPEKETTLSGSLSLNGSPVTFSGVFSSLFLAPYGNCTLAVRSLDLARFTRYAEKYLGYPVRRGELTADVVATLVEKKLDMRNSIVIRDLELGKKTNSPHAPDMPLPTAVALLRDMSGVVALDVPVSGSIGDPEFKLGGVVGAIIGNVILKTVASPFTLLGGLVGGAANIFSDNGPQNVEIVFPIGQDVLDATALEALEELGKELQKHPKAILEVTGVADWGEKSVLVDAWVDKALRNMKYSALPPEKKAETTPDKIRVSPTRNAKEHADLLFAVYRKLAFVKKSNDPEITNPQSTRAIMRILRSRIEISDKQLLLLARTRAYAVYKAVSQGKIDLAARIRLHDPILADAEKSGERIASFARIVVKK